MNEELSSETESSHPIGRKQPDEMNFLEHLEDLRGTLIKCMVAFIIACVVVMSFMKFFADILNWPLQVALGDNVEIVQQRVTPGMEGYAQPSQLDGAGTMGKRQFGLITTSPMAVFSVILQVSFMGGLALSLPFMLYFIAKFVSPGLTEKELSVLRPACIAAFTLFIIGVVFSYFALVPASLKASIFFNEMFGFQVLWSADRYYGLLVWMTLGIGISFQFPLVLVILVYVGILSVEKLRAFRSYSIVAFLAVAAVVTPTTDPITFLLLALPMTVLYELAILVSVRVERSKAKDEETAEPSVI